MNQKVLIFTKKVLPNSNTFVAVQSRNTPKYAPVYIGFKKTPAASTLIGDAPTCVLNQHEKMAGIKKFALECCSVVPKNWAKALDSYKAVLIHAHFGKGGYYCLPIAKQLKLPLIVTFHGSDITQKDKLSYSKKHRALVFQQADKIIAVSSFIENKLLESGCPAHKIVKLYTGIDTQFFTPSHHQSAKPTVLFVGRLIKQKGCHLLISAIKKVMTVIPDVKLIIVGDGVERANLENQAAGLQNVHFEGEKTSQEVKDFLSKAWLMCAPSIVLKRGNEEGLGSVFIEAQAMETPVVTFNTGGVSEAVRKNETGFVLDKIDEAHLADALIELLTNTNLREQFKTACSAHIRQNFDVIKQSEKLSALYQEVIAKFLLAQN